MQRPLVDDNGIAWRSWVISCGSRYWPNDRTIISALPVPQSTRRCSGKVIDVGLPDWAANMRPGTPRSILVDEAALSPGDAPAYERCDWILAAYLHLTGANERSLSTSKPSFHSYSYKLKGIDPRLFDRPWANWIFVFLRNWAARNRGTDADALFGPFPAHQIDLTHDVDALDKTLEIRIKQSAFHLYNAGRAAQEKDTQLARNKLTQAARFAFTSGNFWTLPSIREKEDSLGLRSTFHFYGGSAGLRRLNPIRMLLDPAYDVRSDSVSGEIRRLRQGGWRVGLHQRYTASPEQRIMEIEKRAVEEACGEAIERCRQHWLCFSWENTWRTQEACGLRLDTTLGFNDRPAFRNGCALRFSPWDETNDRAMELQAIPMLFMDAHFYDYSHGGGHSVGETMAVWLDEVEAVGGIASVCWHTHTIGSDYNWGAGYDELLGRLAS